MNRLARLVVPFATLVVPVVGGQGPNLGKPVEAYEIEPGFIATVSRNVRGEVREIHVERGNCAGSRKIHHGSTMSEADRDRIIDVLVPESPRGGRLQSPWYGLTKMASGMAEKNLSFDRVAVYEYSTYSEDRCAGSTVLVVTWLDVAESPSPSQSN